MLNLDVDLAFHNPKTRSMREHPRPACRRSADAPDAAGDNLGVRNWERWSSDEFEDLFAKLVAETVSDKRAAIAIRMQEIMEESGGYVWLTHEPEVFIHRADISTRFAPSGEMLLPYFS